MFNSIEEFLVFAKANKFPVLEGDPEIGQWYRVPIPGAVSANGSPYWGYYRKGTEPNLIVSFSGGGVSINEYTAARPTVLDISAGEVENFYSSVDLLPAIDLILNKGIFDQAIDNPYRNWNCIFVGYVTGDFHVGNGDFHYTAPDGSPAVVHHHGYRNYRMLLDEVIQYVVSPEKLLITGSSAGAFGASGLASDIMSYFPECEDVTCCPDSSLLLHDEWKHIAQNVWHADEAIWKPLNSRNICLDWLRGLYADKRDKVKYLYICSVRDNELARYQNYVDQGQLKFDRDKAIQFQKDLKDMVQELKVGIPGIGIFLFDTPAPGADPELLGTQHCLIQDEGFSKPLSHGYSLRDWLWNAMNGNIQDVGLELLDKK
ncbi:pectin acetylesterase-family hydrolase [Paenibacillus sp. Leaf72]|uniref:pectin acetylesterase-family hydrolase n=1 Tax=Paenibacillus sp. Leaf72 TaxID=1736234 RepID=UPI0006FCF04C|nr:pectin acetylesterase-family hydrolase [Paenibacillus sp. Leaf72]KQO05878.1 hypothetical protein ASF12_32800 [Paenibacillus sp. Leaf72]